ncbi:hypothetical protein T4B_5901 [Trichinella pseudospiralis]|uniref:Uncharacterized protein n=1 Tax=Trichinella pseudospiralis TaxID=6337 RepID=A0A0V1IQ28_TRIPS|nr:hypothetical protein T4B_5901 [Trichinella pseudospiralis]
MYLKRKNIAMLIYPSIFLPWEGELNINVIGQNLVNVKLLMSGKLTGCFFECNQREDHISPIVKPADRWSKIVA